MLTMASRSPVKESRHILVTFLHNYRWGWQIRGDERGFLEKARVFKKRGWNLHVIEKSPSMQKDISESIYNSMILGNPQLPPKTVFDLIKLTFQCLILVFRKNILRPVAIYAYNQDVENSWPAYCLKLIARAPMVVIYHQIRSASAESLSTGIHSRRRRGYGIIRSIWYSLLPAVNRLALRHADVHIALSEATRSDVEHLLGIHECKVIGNGIDTFKFKPLDFPRIYDAAFLGRLAPQKGIDLLLKAWQIVTLKIPQAKLLLIGGGESAHVVTYRQMIHELGLEDNVIMTGFLKDEEVVKMLNKSRLFVFPSRKEGFAQAVSQAMACGMCCILSDIPPLRENYGESATFVTPEDVGALGTSVLSLLRDNLKMSQLRTKARALAMKFSWDSTVDQEIRAIQVLT
jgi:glycosyltransferase involved in cell wall biosynthesis